MLNHPTQETQNAKAYFDRAREALEQEEQRDSVLPTFVPSSLVFTAHERGFETYIKAGLLAEKEVFTMFAKSSSQLGLTALPLQITPRSAAFTNYFAISLAT